MLPLKYFFPIFDLQIYKICGYKNKNSSCQIDHVRTSNKKNIADYGNVAEREWLLGECWE